MTIHVGDFAVSAAKCHLVAVHAVGSFDFGILVAPVQSRGFGIY
jgi:hypothetical protein